MQWSLILLILMGHCSFFTCHLYEYHFIEEKKTWHEARSYCRENYTDLATVYDMTDMTDMKRLNDPGETPTEAWIGLYSITGEEETKWRWSLPGLEFNINKIKWKQGKPHDNNHKYCVMLKSPSHKLDTECCTSELEFVCFNESSSKKIYWISDRKETWPQAQSYCREHHTDLVSGDQLDDEKLREEIKSGKKNNKKLWIGLFRDTWRWSDGSNSSFRHWDQDLFKVGRRDKECAFFKKSGKWDSDKCTNTKPFFCYEDKVILIKQKKTWDDALDYCRENHHDLVSITNLHQQRWVQQRAKNASSLFVWLGLRYTCTLGLWFWVSDVLVCYDSWAPKQETDRCYHAAAMEAKGKYEWFKKADKDVFEFICARKWL